MISLIISLLILGIVLWAIEALFGGTLDAKIMQIIRVVFIIIALLMVLNAFGVLSGLGAGGPVIVK